MCGKLLCILNPQMELNNGNFFLDYAKERAIRLKKNSMRKP